MAAKKVVEKMVKVDEKALKAVAKDLNDVLGLEPAIDLKAKDLLERVRDEAASVGIDPKTGKISQKLVDGDKKELQPETWEFLEEHKMLEHLGAEEEEEDDAEEAEKPLKKADKKAAKAVAVKEEEEENEEEEEDDAEEEKPAIKPSAKKAGKAPAEVVKVGKTSFGSMENSQAGFIDKLLLDGVTQEEGITAVAKEFYNNDMGKAKSRFKIHITFLQKHNKAIITTDKKGVIIAKIAK